MNTLTKLNPFKKHYGALERWSPVARWDPFREMEEEMARLWNRLDILTGRGPTALGGGDKFSATTWSPSVDIIEDEKEFVVKAELPEVKKSDIKVQVEDGMLLISGERKAEHEEHHKKFHRIERSYGSFERSFELPGNADTGKITSEFKDGLLMVHLPKIPGVAHKAIDVKVT